MALEVWTAKARNGFVQLAYTRGQNNYPISESHSLIMPDGYDPSSPEHEPLSRGFPTVTPLLQGFDINFGTTDGGRQDHHIRQLRIDVQNDGWYTNAGPDGIIAQGPNVKIIVGMRDNSGGDPPDDPFVAWIHLSALVIYY